MPRSPLNVAHIPAKANRGRLSSSANHATSFLFNLGAPFRCISAKLLAGVRHPFSGFSQPLQRGDAVLRILVAAGPPLRGGGGMPSASQPAQSRSHRCGGHPIEGLMLPVLDLDSVL